MCIHLDHVTTPASVEIFGMNLVNLGFRPSQTKGNKAGCCSISRLQLLEPNVWQTLVTYFSLKPVFVLSLRRCKKSIYIYIDIFTEYIDISSTVLYRDKYHIVRFLPIHTAYCKWLILIKETLTLTEYLLLDVALLHCATLSARILSERKNQTNCIFS